MNKMAPIGFQINAEKIYQDIAYAYDNIPVYGVILLNEKQTKIVCVSAKGKLGLPKGKVDEGETPTICATRECWEEIGYDVSTKINFYDKIEVEGDVKKTVFFIVSNVKEESVKVLYALYSLIHSL
jgi:mRNA-decapping enzyme subunit 2